MTIRIDEIETDIDVRGEAPGSEDGRAAKAPLWQALERLRLLNDRREKDEARIRAWHHDD